MSRGKMGVFASVAAVALMVGSAPVSADNHLIGAVDNTAPIVPTNFEVGPDPDDASRIKLTWDLSTSDVAGYTATGNNANASGANIVASNDVTGYILTRSETGGDDVETSLAPGVSEYVDADVTAGVAYSYTLTVTDGTNSVSTGALSVNLGDPPIAVDGDDLIFPPAGDEPLGEIDVTNNLRQSYPIGIGNAAAETELTIELFPIAPCFAEPSVGDVLDVYLVPPGNELEFDLGIDAALVGSTNGEHSCTITVETNDPNFREVVYTLSATIINGVDVARLDVVGESLTFVDVPFGETRIQPLTITNTGGLPLTADLDLTGDLVFDIAAEDESIFLNATSEAVVQVSFTPAAAGGEYSGLITITSVDDPAAAISITLAGTEGTVAPDNPVEEEVVQVVITMSADVSDPEIYVDGSTANEAFKASARAVFAAQLGIPESRIIITLVVQSSTEVTFQILDPPEDDLEAPSAADAAAALETIVADEPETLVAALEAETGEELGTVDAIASEPVVVVIQPIDAEGNAVAGWFTRTGTRVDLTDFFALADAFGSSLGDPSFDSVFDISGEDLVPDGLVNFADFFRFADDFGKTVANAADVQAILGG